MDDYLKNYKPCAECGCQMEKKAKKCSVCGSTKFGTYENKLLTDKEVRELFPEIPQRGLWYEIIDFSERDYGSDWGFYGFADGHHVENSGGLYSQIRKAGDAAREWKASEKLKRMRKPKGNTYGTGYMRQD